MSNSVVDHSNYHSSNSRKRRSNDPIEILRISGHRGDINGRGPGHSASREPYINRLSYEVLALIFQFFVDEGMEEGYVRPRGVFPLGATCRAWRNIAWTSCRLWASLSFQIQDKTTEKHIQLAIEWLGRSGNLPLSIYLQGSSRTGDSILIPLIDVINLSLNRCRQLSLIDISFSILSRLTSGSKAATTLEWLKIKPNSYIPTPVKFVSAAPVKLELWNMGSAELILKWTALTELVAHELFVDQIIEILTLAPRIVRCSFSKVQFKELDYKIETVKCVEMQYLTIAAMKHPEDDEVFPYFFQAIAAPKLMYCSLQYYYAPLGHVYFPTEAFMDFVVRSGCALTDLSIDEQGITCEDLIRTTQALPSLTSLSLTLGYRFVPKKVRHTPLLPFYNALCQDTRDPTIPYSGALLLPALKKLSVETQDIFPWWKLPKFRLYKQRQSVCPIDQGGPYLESISIIYDHDRPNFYTMDDAGEEEIVSKTIHRFLIPDWETFSELLELQGNVHLDLAATRMAHINDTSEKEDMFYLSYRALTETVGDPPDHIRIAMKGILRTPRTLYFSAYEYDSDDFVAHKYDSDDERYWSGDD